MTISLETLVNQKISQAFDSLNLDKKFAFVKVSDRPDLTIFKVCFAFEN